MKVVKVFNNEELKAYLDSKNADRVIEIARFKHLENENKYLGTTKTYVGDVEIVPMNKGVAFLVVYRDEPRLTVSFYCDYATIKLIY